MKTALSVKAIISEGELLLRNLDSADTDTAAKIYKHLGIYWQELWEISDWEGCKAVARLQDRVAYKVCRRS